MFCPCCFAFFIVKCSTPIQRPWFQIPSVNRRYINQGIWSNKFHFPIVLLLYYQSPLAIWHGPYVVLCTPREICYSYYSRLCPSFLIQQIWSLIKILSVYFYIYLSINIRLKKYTCIIFFLIFRFIGLTRTTTKHILIKVCLVWC